MANLKIKRLQRELKTMNDLLAEFDTEQKKSYGRNNTNAKRKSNIPTKA